MRPNNSGQSEHLQRKLIGRAGLPNRGEYGMEQECALDCVCRVSSGAPESGEWTETCDTVFDDHNLPSARDSSTFEAPETGLCFLSIELLMHYDLKNYCTQFIS